MDVPTALKIQYKRFPFNKYTNLFSISEIYSKETIIDCTSSGRSILLYRQLYATRWDMF